MFTGIIEEIGSVLNVPPTGKSGKISIKAVGVLQGSKIGDSIAVNGVCLTITAIADGLFFADVMAETLRRSNLGSLKPGDKVNLERALSSDGRFGGHIVSGHIDGTGVISRFKNEENATWVYVNTSSEIINLIVEKGSIAIDGISLTVASVTESDFAASIIPHTGQETTLLEKKIGDKVNLENDIIGKYVQKLMGLRLQQSPKDRDKKFLDWLES
ncbi:MAG: riboflavin synthase [Treponemataceae bacterium]|nr:riboflavin synthase [Treponema sp.]MBD5443833.1 riboflavin synthase [Treponema sp.]MDE6245743.1 riboflavin synthase [Treponemataceae bacterium]